MQQLNASKLLLNAVVLKSTVFIVLAVKVATAQTLNIEPTYPIFRPLLADPKEPRIGTLINQNNDELSLDIGACLDLAQMKLARLELGFGVDFGTFSELRRAPFFKFPVNSADYIFGFNASFMFPLENERAISGRFRLSHISAHLVDGQYANGAWLDGLSPFTYSREFIAFILAVSSKYGRLYAGFEFLFNTIPRNIAASSMQAGLEIHSNQVRFYNIYPYLALDFRLVPIWRRNLDQTQGYGGVTSIQVGFKINPIGKRGMRLFFNHFGGIDFRGLYLGRTASENSLGFLIDI